MNEFRNVGARHLEKFLGSPQITDGKIHFQRSVELDEEEAFPTLEVAYLNQWGVQEYYVPVQWGGKLQRVEELLAIIRTISRRDLTVAIGHAKTALGALPVWISGNDEQKKFLSNLVIQGNPVSLALTEKGHGSDLLANECSATRLEDGTWQLSGEKWLINNATRGKVLCVLAKTSPNYDAKSLSFFIFKKGQSGEGFENLPKIRTHGIRGADISGIRFRKSSLPSDSMIGRVGQGFEIILKTFQFSRTLCAGLSLGAAESAFDMCLNFVEARALYGKSLWKTPLIQKRLVDILVELWICDALAIGAARSLHFLPGEMSLLSSICKYFVPVQVSKCLEELKVILGARFYLREEHAFGAFQKILRDHDLVALFDGSTQVNLYIIATQMRALALARSGNSPSPSLASLEPVFNIELAPPQYDFLGFKLSNCGIDTWMSGLDSLSEDSDSFIRRSARKFLEIRDGLDREVLELSEVYKDPMSCPDLFDLAMKQCYLHAAVATLMVAKVNPNLQDSPVNAWLTLAVTQLLQDLGASRDAELNDFDLRGATQTIWEMIEERSRKRMDWGIAPICNAY